MGSLRSALVVAVPEAGEIVEGWRERTCDDKPSIGIPAHVTLLFPFVDPGGLDSELPSLRRLFSGYEPFGYALAEMRRFPNVLYLAPAPAMPFVELIRAVIRSYPEHPPYGGALPRDSIVPHVTVASGDARVQLTQKRRYASVCRSSRVRVTSSCSKRSSPPGASGRRERGSRSGQPRWTRFRT